MHHLGVPLAVLLRQLRLLTLQIGELALQLLDVLVTQHGGQCVDRRCALHRLQLVVERLLLDPHGLGLGDGPVQIREPLHDDVLAVLDRDRVVRLLVALERRLALLDLAPLLGQPLAQPVGGVLRGGEPGFEVLLDVGLREPVGHVGRELRLRRRDPQLDDPAVAHGHDVQRPEDQADVLRQRVTRVLTRGGGLLGWSTLTALRARAIPS